MHIQERQQHTATVCFLCRDNEVLLARKTKNIGKGKRNGYGGGIHVYETISHCALRELWEESGVSATHNDLEKVAIVEFHNTTAEGEQFTITVHVFLVHHWTGEPVETVEMEDPRWYRKNALPFEDLMPSDKHWLALALSGQKLLVEAHLGPNQESHTSGTIMQTVDTFPY